VVKLRPIVLSDEMLDWLANWPPDGDDWISFFASIKEDKFNDPHAAWRPLSGLTVDHWLDMALPPRETWEPETL
jgi:hypothetical protein